MMPDGITMVIDCGDMREKWSKTHYPDTTKTPGSGTALTGGMTVDELKAINTNISILRIIPEDVEVDQKGNKRTGTVMGAYVGK